MLHRLCGYHVFAGKGRRDPEIERGMDSYCMTDRYRNDICLYLYVIRKNKGADSDKNEN